MIKERQLYAPLPVSQQPDTDQHNMCYSHSHQCGLGVGCNTGYFLGSRVQRCMLVSH